MNKLLALTVFSALLLACGDEQEPDGGGELAVAPGDALVVGADFMAAGIFSIVDVEGLAVTKGVLNGVASADPLLRVVGDRAFIVNRRTANITIIDLKTMSLVDQVSTGENNNPQDIAVLDNKLYVATFAAPGLVVFDLNDLAAPPLSIDLGKYDPTDDEANAGTLGVVDGRVIVALGRLDAGFKPQGVGIAVAIDPATDAIVDDFELTRPNPFGIAQVTPQDSAFAGDMIVSTVNFDDSSGCLQRISASGAASCIADNAVDLGGYVNGLAYDATTDTVLVAVTNSDFSGARLLSVSANGDVGPSITSPEQFPQDVEVCSTGDIVVVESPFGDAAKGLRIFTSDQVEVTTELIDVGLPPAPIGGVVCL